MSGNTVTIFRFFWPDQDLQQEQWLREMARQGLHLQGFNILSRWTFRKGPAADVAYRIDFPGAPVKADYRQLMQDAGWELALGYSGWEYWRKAVVDGKAPEIFTDTASKTKRFERVLAALLMSALPMMVAIVVVDKEKMLAQLSWQFLALAGAAAALWIPLIGYSCVRLARRIGQAGAAQS
ncbi:DUF2812 domain-containing protein [Massilia glaciei]|uniref:DUF2812 domain-containing protein n=1 Tax=Massilia glaciei TaxID=1524097 RepID=A0A2U2HFH6_9BURK|nr:DUF2812 domain-containing protein [Massilia glaciei]PWF43088.1 DUF2812 domain-containing protein [Massilia glaciei]